MMSRTAFSCSGVVFRNRPPRLGPSAETQQYLLPPAPNLARWQSEQRWKNTAAPLACWSVNCAPSGWWIGADRWVEAAWPSCADTSAARPTKSAAAKPAARLIRAILACGITRYPAKRISSRRPTSGKSLGPSVRKSGQRAGLHGYQIAIWQVFTRSAPSRPLPRFSGAGVTRDHHLRDRHGSPCPRRVKGGGAADVTG